MESNEYKELKKKLLSGRKNGYDRVGGDYQARMEAYCAGYMAYLDAGKTERLCAAETVRLAEEKGYRPYVRGMELKPGDKVYLNNRGKSVLLAHIGEQSLAEGVQIAAAHIDSPRLDLKPTPLYEDGELAYFKTHYYGGLRKYQWVTIPLELHGVVALKDHSKVSVSIGTEPGDPRLVITDLLPHLGAEQSKKPLGEAVAGETLNLLLGSRPIGGEEESGRVKLAVMQLLNEKYGITEDDFASAELEAVPAGKACHIGLDRSMIGAYGHDDRVCAYAALKALLDLDKTPGKTAVCVLADKECPSGCALSAPSASAPTSPPPSTPTTPMSMKSATPPTSTTAWAFASIPGPGASPAPPMPMLRRWPISAGSSMTRTSSGRSRSWARWTPAAAAPWPCIWPTATSPRWTQACRF